MDDDVVDTSNLQRQIAHTESRQGLYKAESLCQSLRQLNSSITTKPYVTRLTADNVVSIFSEHDVIVDCTDNPSTRYLINDCAVLLGKPLISGAALGTDGQLSTYNYMGSPCYRCVHPVPPQAGNVQSCADAGVLGPVTGVIGCLQAMEVLKLAAHAAEKSYEGVHMGESMAGKLLIFDGADTRFRVVKLKGRRDDCAVCGKDPSIRSMEDRQVKGDCSWCNAHS